jgi:hypothetical protein
MENEIENTHEAAEYTPQAGADWRAGLPPDLQHAVKDHNDLPGFVRAFIDTKNFVGKKFEEFSQQDAQRFQALMSNVDSIPSPDGYQIDPIPLNGGESSLMEEDTQSIRELSHGLGLSNEQAQMLHDVADDFVKRVVDARQNEVNCAHENCLRDLAGAWGNAYEGKIQAIENAISNVLPQFLGTDSESIREELQNVQLYNSPVLLKTLAFLGEMMMDSSSRGYGNIAPMDAQSRFENMRNDPEFMKARLNRHHPMHQQAVEQFRLMCEQANN